MSDTYLSLCLAQADLSPLHYRHGAIIVRGGKVIGQGYNTYRPGFDGGALKSGALPSVSLDGPAITELKQRLKKGYRVILKNAKPEHVDSKPTRKPSVRRQHPQAMARLPVASSLFKSRVLNPLHLNQVQQDKKKVANVKGEDSGFHNEKANENVTTNTSKSAEKQRLQKRPSYLYQDGYQYEGHYHHKTQQMQNAQKQGWISESKTSKGSMVDSQRSSPDDDLKSSNKNQAKSRKKAPIPTQPQQILITKNKSSSKPNTAARTKDRRLNGSDLYVARLGIPQKSQPKPKIQLANPPNLPPPVPLKSPPVSLYDELSPHLRSSSLSSPKAEPLPSSRPEIRASKPCYRCVSAMHAAGIKRVFWTTQGGEWEMAKVRDLVDALEGGIDGDGNSDGEGLGAGQESKGVFVTKHEVLMLKRAMGF